MSNKKNWFLWLALPLLAIFAVLLIWQFGFRKEMERPAAHGLDGTLVQNKTTVSVTVNTKPCIQQPIQIGEVDFTPVDNALKCIIAEYTNAAARKDKERILALDNELKELVYAVQSIRNHDAWNAFWRNKEQPRYQYQKTIGVYIDDKSLRYDGGLRYDNVMQSRTETLAGFDLLKPRFEQIRAAFLAIPKTPEISNIENLYGLDEQLEDLVAEAKSNLGRSTQLPNYPEIGVYLEQEVHYTGAIRQAADKLLPPAGFIDPKTGKRIEVKGDRYSRLKGKLEEIYQTYKSLKQAPEDAEKLYELSEALDKVVDEIHKVYPWKRSQVFWDDKYMSLGLYVGHYSDQLDYGGKLTVESYKLNPNSRYGEATLVAAISGGGDMSELSGVPDIGLAKRYLEKYPDGEYLRSVYGILATFYLNLYEGMLEGDESSSMIYCFNDYLATHPEDKDREVVRNKAIEYYKKLLPFEPQAQDEYNEALSNLENRRAGNVRYWCTD